MPVARSLTRVLCLAAIIWGFVGLLALTYRSGHFVSGGISPLHADSNGSANPGRRLELRPELLGHRRVTAWSAMSAVFAGFAVASTARFVFRSSSGPAMGRDVGSRLLAAAATDNSPAGPMLAEMSAFRAQLRAEASSAGFAGGGPANVSGTSVARSASSRDDMPVAARATAEAAAFRQAMRSEKTSSAAYPKSVAASATQRVTGMNGDSANSPARIFDDMQTLIQAKGQQLSETMSAKQADLMAIQQEAQESAQVWVGNAHDALQQTEAAMADSAQNLSKAQAALADMMTKEAGKTTARFQRISDEIAQTLSTAPAKFACAVEERQRSFVTSVTDSADRMQQTTVNTMRKIEDDLGRFVADVEAAPTNAFAALEKLAADVEAAPRNAAAALEEQKRRVEGEMSTKAQQVQRTADNMAAAPGRIAQRVQDSVQLVIDLPGNVVTTVDASVKAVDASVRDAQQKLDNIGQTPRRVAATVNKTTQNLGHAVTAIVNMPDSAAKKWKQTQEMPYKLARDVEDSVQNTQKTLTNIAQLPNRVAVTVAKTIGVPHSASASAEEPQCTSDNVTQTPDRVESTVKAAQHGLQQVVRNIAELPTNLEQTVKDAYETPGRAVNKVQRTAREVVALPAKAGQAIEHAVEAPGRVAQGIEHEAAKIQQMADNAIALPGRVANTVERSMDTMRQAAAGFVELSGCAADTIMGVASAIQEMQAPSNTSSTQRPDRKTGQGGASLTASNEALQPQRVDNPPSVAVQTQEADAEGLHQNVKNSKKGPESGGPKIQKTANNGKQAMQRQTRDQKRESLEPSVDTRSQEKPPGNAAPRTGGVKASTRNLRR